MTIGHSTRSLEDFVALLEQNGVELLVDVRTVPASRRVPHFAKQALERSLPAHRIAYIHMPELGGLRKPRPDSINLGWRNASFRGFGDYMQTDDFQAAIERLVRPVAPSAGSAGTSPRAGRMAIMCAEAVPWRCHRSLIADALLVRGIEVRHVTGAGEPSPHRLTRFAVVADGVITYPPPDTLAL